jgi:hypothetical protein
MRTKGPVALVVSLLLAMAWPQWSLATPVTIDYQATDLGAGRWCYTYTVTNSSLTEAVREFTIWFDKGSCTNLEVVSADPPAGGWSELVSQPDPVLGDTGFYDALSLGTGIAAGATVGGFSVAFNWQRTDVPGPQAFDVVNPTTFATLTSGVTTPEPGSVLLLATAAAGLTMPFRPRRVK